MRLRVGQQHSLFWPILTRFVDYYSPFWGPKATSMVVEPHGALKCSSSTITVWVDSGPFVRVLLSFGGPGVISTIYEPRDAFTCRSSTLTVLANSGPFRGLLLNVLGPRSDFHD